MGENRYNLFTAAGLLAVGLLAGVMVANLGAAAAGIEQQARPAINSDAPLLDEVIPQGAFVRVAEQTQPALVYIQTRQTVSRGQFLGELPESFRRFFGDDEESDPSDEQTRVGQGSGFLIASSGYIVTNAHVVSQIDTNAVEVVKADSVTVRLFNEDEYEATIVGVDIGTDLAVLKIDPGYDLPHVPLGDSDRSRVGEWVMALGAPFGLTNTVSAGIVSAKGRARIGGLTGSAYQDFIQTDAAINRGNSGGPLVNLRGEVIGINTAIMSNGFQGQFAGVGFAIPINLVSGVVDQLIEHGRTIRGWLGIAMRALHPDAVELYNLEAREVGGAVQISEVNPGQPADLAGVEEGDIVVGTGGVKLEDDQDFLQRIAMTPPDESIRLDIIRLDHDFERHDLSIDVVLGERPPEIEVLADNTTTFGVDPERSRRGGRDRLTVVESEFGMTVSNLNERWADQLDWDIDRGGVVVTGVVPGGLAEQSNGLIAGTIIREVNRRAVRNVEEFEAAVEAVEPGKLVEFLLRYPSGSGARVPVRRPE